MKWGLFFLLYLIVLSSCDLFYPPRYYDSLLKNQSSSTGGGGSGSSSSQSSITNWTPFSVAASALYCITFGNGYYITAGAGGNILYSQYGTNGSWTSAVSGTTSDLNAIITTPIGIFVNGSMFYVLGSTNGIAWQALPAVATYAQYALAYGGGNIWLVSVGGVTGGEVIGTNVTMGTSWTEGTVAAPGALKGIYYNSSSDYFVAVGAAGSVVKSYAPATVLTWYMPTNVGGSNPNLNSICFNGVIYVAVGAGGAVFYSADASSWTQAASITTNNLNKVIAVGSGFIAVGDQGTVLYGSAGGSNWQYQNIGTTANLKDIYAGPKLVIAVDNGNIYMAQ